MGMKLFDDAGSDDDLEKISKIEVNKEFAKRFEHNKKREDLQRYEEMKKKGLVNDSDSSESESESESDVDADVSKDVKFFDNLVKIRKKDPILHRKDAKLFESSDDESVDRSDDGGERKKKVKPRYLKDVVAQNLIEEGPEFEEEDDYKEREMKKGKSFVEEQEELRNEVLAAMEAAERENGDGIDSEGEGGGLLREKERSDGNAEEDDDEDVVKYKLDEYFGEDEELDEKEMFLKDYFKNKMWIAKEERRNVDDDEEEGVVGLSDDEEVLEKQEDYEREYNFRFEENKSDRVLGHSRVVEGSVRKETNARKQQRERKKERMELAEAERREEVKRLKNLKRKEIQEKLSKIREIAGVDGEDIPLDEDDLEGDFDPEEFDRKMKKAFGDEYYQAEDVDPEFGNESDEEEGDLEKPDFDKEDELLGLPKDWDVIKSNDGFLAEREKMMRSRVENENGGDEDNEEEEEREEGKRKRKRKSKLKEALDKELEEELYKLDYEDTIGDLKTRFKYRQVKPDRFKLSAAEILEFDEKELNQYVSLKKLAPYRDQEWKVPQVRKQMLLGGLLNKPKKHKKRKTMDGEGPSEIRKEKDLEEDANVGEEKPSNEENKLSRKAKRRQRQKEKKLPASRLIAYGKIPASSVYNSKK